MTDPHIDYRFNPSDRLLVNAWPGPDQQPVRKLREFLRTVAAADPKNQGSTVAAWVLSVLGAFGVGGLIGALIVGGLAPVAAVLLP